MSHTFRRKTNDEHFEIFKRIDCLSEKHLTFMDAFAFQTISPILAHQI